MISVRMILISSTILLLSAPSRAIQDKRLVSKRYPTAISTVSLSSILPFHFYSHSTIVCVSPIINLPHFNEIYVRYITQYTLTLQLFSHFFSVTFPVKLIIKLTFILL